MYDLAWGSTEEYPSLKGQILGSKLPRSLESLHIFEDFNIAIHGRDVTNEPRTFGIQVLKCLAVSAPNLRHLSVSFLSDAMDCFELSDGTSSNLELIALTSSAYLQPNPALLNELLYKAAITAMKMSELQIMELSNCSNGHADIIRYESEGTAESSAYRLTWRSSWCRRRSALYRSGRRWHLQTHYESSFPKWFRYLTGLILVMEPFFTT